MLRLTGQFLDKDGKVVGRASTTANAVPGSWTSCALRLDRTAPGRRYSSAGQIPEKATYFEPQILTGGSQCDISSLYFGEILPTPTPTK